MLQGIGILLIVLALIAFIVWFFNNRKAGKIRTVPFKRPSEIAQQGMNAGDAKQMVSCEGQVTGQPIQAPMSGQPCVYWEIDVTRGYHTTTTNSDGSTSKSHSTKSLLDQKQGTVFQLHDGQGAVGVDTTKTPSGFDLKKTHESRVNVGIIVPNQIAFGNMQLQTAALAANIAGLITGGEITDYYEGTEKIIPYQQGQTLFALGKLAQGPMGLVIGDPGMLGSLMLSDKGREATLGTAVKYAKIALIAGAAMAGIGVILTVVGFIVTPSEPDKPTAAATATATAAEPAADSTAADSAAPGKPGVQPRPAVGRPGATPAGAATGAQPAATGRPTAAPAVTPKPAAGRPPPKKR